MYAAPEPPHIFYPTINNENEEKKKSNSGLVSTTLLFGPNPCSDPINLLPLQ